jgi:hypothetical protein
VRFDESKTLGPDEGAAPRFLRASIGDDVTRGFDVDSLYCEVTEGRILWTIIEMLKCNTVPPEASHPRFYWETNKRKFLSLWALCKSLQHGNVDARLVLVNFRDEFSLVKRFYVTGMSEAQIIVDERPPETFENWAKAFRRFNKFKRGATWDALPLLTR